MFRHADVVCLCLVCIVVSDHYVIFPFDLKDVRTKFEPWAGGGWFMH